MKVVCFDLDGTIYDLRDGEHRARHIIRDRLAQESGVPRDEVTGVYDIEWAKTKMEYMGLVAAGLEDIDIRERHMGKILDIFGLESSPLEYAEVFCSETMNGIYIYPDSRGVMDALKASKRIAYRTIGERRFQPH